MLTRTHFLNCYSWHHGCVSASFTSEDTDWSGRILTSWKCFSSEQFKMDGWMRELKTWNQLPSEPRLQLSFQLCLWMMSLLVAMKKVMQTDTQVRFTSTSKQIQIDGTSPKNNVKKKSSLLLCTWMPRHIWICWWVAMMLHSDSVTWIIYILRTWSVHTAAAAAAVMLWWRFLMLNSGTAMSYVVFFWTHDC